MPHWQWPVVLCLVQPLIACTWLGWLAASYKLYVTASEYQALGLAVWLIYVVDGLLDARNHLEGEPLSPRRAFLRRHAGWFWLLAFVGSGLLLGLVLSDIGSGLFLSGVFLGVLVLFYLGHAQGLRKLSTTLLPKEVFGGVLFAMGVGLVIIEAHGRGAVGPVSMEAAGMAIRGGLFSALIWLAQSLVFLLLTIFTDGAVVLFAMLCVANTLLTAQHEAPGIGDVTSAKRVAPGIVALGPVLTLALAFSSLVNFLLNRTPELRPVHGAISLCAALLFGVHYLARRKTISGPLAAFLLDVSLLAPLLLFPLNPPV